MLSSTQLAKSSEQILLKNADSKLLCNKESSNSLYLTQPVPCANAFEKERYQSKVKRNNIAIFLKLKEFSTLINDTERQASSLLVLFTDIPAYDKQYNSTPPQATLLPFRPTNWLEREAISKQDGQSTLFRLKRFLRSCRATRRVSCRLG